MAARRGVWSRGTAVAAAIAGGVLWFAFGSFASLPAAEPEPAEVDEGFADTIVPLLSARCLACHSADHDINGGLRLDLRDGWVQGGDSGPAIVPGEPDQSLLVRAIRWDPRAPQMPPDGKLAAEEIAMIEAWVRRGAHDPRGGSIGPRSRLLPGAAKGMTADEGRRFWSFLPLADPVPPEVADPDWNRHPIDRFIRARLDAAGLQPQPEASPERLLRRISEDLTGLPPTPEETDAFVSVHARDPDGAVAELVDRLLADPGFGERFGRHWLDLARFAESSGGGRTLLFKDAWRYRDWVIAGVNADIPFDRFVAAQLAGDRLAADGTADPAVVEGIWSPPVSSRSAPRITRNRTRPSSGSTSSTNSWRRSGAPSSGCRSAAVAATIILSIRSRTPITTLWPESSRARRHSSTRPTTSRVGSPGRFPSRRRSPRAAPRSTPQPPCSRLNAPP
jgi:hypothetical protein